MKLYIAGPMTGLPDFNYPAFDAAAVDLAAAGYAVENPAHFEDFEVLTPKPDPQQGEEALYGWYLRAGLSKLVLCDAVALLPGWQFSNGARLECEVARKAGMHVHRLDQWLTAAPLWLEPREASPESMAEVSRKLKHIAQMKRDHRG